MVGQKVTGKGSACRRNGEQCWCMRSHDFDEGENKCPGPLDGQKETEKKQKQIEIKCIGSADVLVINAGAYNPMSFDERKIRAKAP